MIEVDGGEGGGQVLRSAVTLSMLTGDPVTVEDVRGNRSEPGLKPQHLTAVETAAAVCGAAVEGASLGSEQLVFEPGRPTGGRYEAAVGTAGSLTLVFDTLLPVAAVLDEPLTLAASGGTDVAWSPPMAYYRHVKLELLREHGLSAVVDVDRRGFYPAGGGRATLRLWPSAVAPLELAGTERATAARVYSTASASLADADVAGRQTDAAVAALDDLGVEAVETRTTETETLSPGSAVVVRLEESAGDDELTRPVAGFGAYGEPGKPSEDVASDAVSELSAFLESPAAVDEHLADQLLLLLALAGGRVAVPRLTDHVASSLAVFEAFGQDVVVDRSGETPVLDVAEPIDDTAMDDE